MCKKWQEISIETVGQVSGVIGLGATKAAASPVDGGNRLNYQKPPKAFSRKLQMQLDHPSGLSVMCRVTFKLGATVAFPLIRQARRFLGDTLHGFTLLHEIGRPMTPDEPA